MDTAAVPASADQAIAKVAIAIPLSKITPSPTNPRKTFDEAKLQELATSIEANGLLSPITVRPHPATDGEPFYELVFGERRWRASEIAGLAEIPAFVEPMSDIEAAERQIVENAQRVDISPLEEGEAYAQLLKLEGNTIETLISKVGRSRSHIYARMKLTTLAPFVVGALREGRLGTTIAELATRIGDAGLQEQFARQCLGDSDDDAHESMEGVGIVPELVSDDGRPFPTRDASQPLSTRAAVELLRRRYSTRLSLAKFPISDPSLTAAGSCTTCPHRSGNQPDLPGVTNGRADDLCLKPSCYADKTQAEWSRAADAAQARGVKVVPAAAAKRCFGFDGVTVLPTSPYVDPDQEVPAGLARAGVKASWAKLLGKRAADVPRVLVQDETGAARELLARDEAIALLAKLGKIDAPEPPRAKASESGASSPGSSKRVDGGGSAGEAEEGEDYPAQAERRRKLIARLKEDVIVEASKGLPEKKRLAWWRWLIACLIDGMFIGSDHPLIAESGIDTKQPWEPQLVEKAKNVDKAFAIVTGLVFSEAVERIDPSELDDDDDAKLAILKLFGIDVAKVALEVADAENGTRISPLKPSRKGGRS